jgi:hypothetical protein
VLLESEYPFEGVRDTMDCCERSECAKSLAAELKAILEWDGAGLRPGMVSGGPEMESRVARNVRGRQIVLELIALRRTCEAQHAPESTPVANCGVRAYFGDKVCSRLLLADAWQRLLDEKKPPASEEGEGSSFSGLSG